MNDSLSFHMLISLNDLSKDINSLIFRKAIGMLLYILCKCSSLEQFHYHVQVVSFDDYFNEFDNIFMTSIVYFAKITKSSNLTAEKIPGNLVIDSREIDRFDGNLAIGLMIE